MSVLPPESLVVAPPIITALPFAALLLAIALFPLTPVFSRWWESNFSKLFLSLFLAAVTCCYYGARGQGFHESGTGISAVATVLNHAVVQDFIPFIVLLFCLYTISGGIRLTGNIPPHPHTNAFFMLTGAILANFVGTTGASMLLIRPLLQINSTRKHVKHTVIFFIFLVSNVGGVLLPLGDPPLFLGYLRSVPFLWTLRLWPQWLAAVGLVLLIYWIMDHYYYHREEIAGETRFEMKEITLALRGEINFLLLLGVVLTVAFIVPGKRFPGTSWTVPDHLREIMEIALAVLSMQLTHKGIREANHFNFNAIAEVACLFIGIFITMQAPLELLQLKGPELGLTAPYQYFWASGALSSFLDNAPTYVVFFETAGSLPSHGVAVLQGVATGTHSISLSLLAAVSCGSVFMGANTYIGNGPNFMVKSIAEQFEVKMPSFFGYMAYSLAILIPVFLMLTVVFFV